ncbi:metaxin-2-like [Brevipalpus obovatus]|uniref:metaxin-2-like n=1 Tax=Brevipalpus obovatus TaxID=246614 RepID=UPI003D9E4A37
MGTMDTAELGGSEPWASDTKLFQPLQDQILLYEEANCRALKAFLRMLNLPFEEEWRVNAEHMSPSNQVPFIKCGQFVVSEMVPIIEFVEAKGYSLSNHLENEDRSDMKAYMNLVDSILMDAEYFVCWKLANVSRNYTRPRFCSFYPWPLNSVLFRMKKWGIEKRLKLRSREKADLTMDSVLEDVKNCLQIITDILGDKVFLYGNKPTELDALLFGHLSAIYNTNLPDNRLKELVGESTKLLEMCARIDDKYISSWKSRSNAKSSSTIKS